MNKRNNRLAGIKKKVLPILKKHSVKRAAIFGSYARGEAKAKSDVDFLIEYKSKNKSLFDLVDLKSDLEEILDRKVDLITYTQVNSRIGDLNIFYHRERRAHRGYF
jgi:uncharacterized protein